MVLALPPVISRLLLTLAGVVACWLLLAPPLQAQGPGKTLTLIYSGNLNGELEPCGCTVDTDYGGILRRAHYIEQLREQWPELILLSTGGLLDKDFPDPIKNNHIISGLAALDYDAVGLQWQDLALGTKLLSDSTLPFVAANWLDQTFPAGRVIERGTHQLLFSQWLDPKSSPYQAMQASSPISTDIEALRQQLHTAKATGQFTLVGTTLTLQQVREQLDLSLIDILLVGSAYEHFGQPQTVGSTLVLQPGSRGQRLGVLTFDITDSQGLGEWHHQVVELSSAVADSAELKPWYEDYNAALKQAYEQDVAAQKARSGGATPFVGAQTCAGCHSEQHKSWQGSEHAVAFNDLEAVNKAFDPNCVGCHSVGFQQPGGFLTVDITPQLAGVQCENCHGAGREHVDSGGASATPNQPLTPQAMCSQCHVSEHSPKFRLQDYWPRIAH